MQKNILVTGGAGFIGSHLTDMLLEQGHSVTVIDDLSTGSVKNLSSVRSNPRLNFVVDSIMNVRLMSELIDWCDHVYHFAAAVGVRLILDKPVQTIETNIRGTEIVLSLAAKKQRKVLITSTSEVYGKGAKVPFCEDDDLVLGATIKPRWGYACSKAIDEFLALAYWREHRVPVVIVRLFNTVGPRQTGRYGMVIPRFAEQALKNEDITVYGDGYQTRSFAHVHDVIGALNSLMNTPTAVGQVFNVGNDTELSIMELAQLVKAQTQSQSEIRCIPFEKAYDENFEDLLRRVPSLEKLKRVIDYAPKYSINDIVSQVVDHTRREMESNG
ncbi:NAD-dependent epimerase/dehydratase family protein [Candidatus Sumerlaeota bacterium]|nr:NAD-dependent epimerase/dehydratase family protein [Candidatus Sumerlaeota bacterium]